MSSAQHLETDALEGTWAQQSRLYAAWINKETFPVTVTGEILGEGRWRRLRVIGEDGAPMLMPPAQVADRPVRDLSTVTGKTLPVRIIHCAPARGLYLVSHRIVEEERARAARQRRARARIETISVGDVVSGVIKNLVDFGVFVDLGGLDGLLHISEMALPPGAHPASRHAMGQTLRVRILSRDTDTFRVKLGLPRTD